MRIRRRSPGGGWKRGAIAGVGARSRDSVALPAMPWLAGSYMSIQTARVVEMEEYYRIELENVELSVGFLECLRGPLGYCDGRMW